jgi:hypothetical protein
MTMAFKLVDQKPKEEPSKLEALHRVPAQALKGAVAVVPGIFGDVASAINNWVAGPIFKAITGEEPIEYEKTLLGKLLLTTAQHTKSIEEAIPYFKPKNKVEQSINDIFQDAASLFLPGGVLTKAGLRGTSLLKSFATSIGSNSAGEFVSAWTGDPQKGAYTKMGTMFLLSAINKPTATKEISKLYDKADELLPHDATVKATVLKSELKGLKKQVLNGRQPRDLAPSEKFVIDQANTVLRQIKKDGTANVSTLKDSLRSLNENLQKAVYEAPDKSVRVRAKILASEINTSINSTLKDYGERNPEWWKIQKSANDAFGTMQQSNFISNFIQDNVVGNPITHGLLQALGVVGVSATAVLPYQAVKLVYRIAKSPTLAKHYSRIVSSAASENIQVMNREIKKLDDELKIDDKKKSNKFRLLN